MYVFLENFFNLFRKALFDNQIDNIPTRPPVVRNWGEGHRLNDNQNHE